MRVHDEANKSTDNAMEVSSDQEVFNEDEESEQQEDELIVADNVLMV